MFITIFIMFISISLILTILGFYTDIPLFALGGTAILFFMGLSLLTTPLVYATGELTNLTYSDNLSNNIANNSGEITTSEGYLVQTLTTETYSTYDDSTQYRLGFIIMSVGILGFCLACFKI
jgi:hypothetical protein